MKLPTLEQFLEIRKKANEKAWQEYKGFVEANWEVMKEDMIRINQEEEDKKNASKIITNTTKNAIIT